MNSQRFRFSRHGFCAAAVVTAIALLCACQKHPASQTPPPPVLGTGGTGAGAPGGGGPGGASPPAATKRAIIYQRNRRVGPDGPWDLRRIDADGMNDVELLADGNYNIEPAWNCRADPVTGNNSFAFASNRLGPFFIFISDDGVGGSIRQVTFADDPPVPNHMDRYPSWNRNAKDPRIVFTSNRKNHTNSPDFHLFTMKPTGTQLLELFNSGSTDSQPVWKPGQVQIAFSSNRSDNNFEIFTINFGGSNLLRVTNLPAKRDVHPTWSINDEIVYESSNPDETQTDLFISLATGGDPRTLRATSTSTPRNVDPAFSPDGSQIVFSKSDASGQFDLYIVDRDGNNEKRITNTPNVSEREPEWIHGPQDTCL